MNAELVPIEHESLPVPARMTNPLDLAPADFRAGLDRRGQNRKSLVEWVRSALVDGVDFGVIQTRRGPSKPSLRKPGAEKICGMLGVTATFPTLRDYEQAALEGRRLEQIILRCHLSTADGTVVADGVGARSVDQDNGDLNKALKMALKSAHIDATLRMAGLSEIFTQDIEDMPREQLEAQSSHGLNGAPDDSSKIPHEAPKQHAVPPVRGERLATERQAKMLRVRLSKAGIAESELCQKFEVADVDHLPFTKVNPALHWIEELAG